MNGATGAIFLLLSSKYNWKMDSDMDKINGTGNILHSFTDFLAKISPEMTSLPSPRLSSPLRRPPPSSFSPSAPFHLLLLLSFHCGLPLFAFFPQAGVVCTGAAERIITDYAEASSRLLAFNSSSAAGLAPGQGRSASACDGDLLAFKPS